MKDNSMTTTHDNTNPVVRKTARIEDRATGQFLEEIEFPVSPGETRRLQLLPSVVADPSKFEGSLIDRGARLPDDTQARKALLTEVAKSEAPNQYVYETRSGWLDPGKVFVLPDGAISVETTNIIGVSPSYSTSDPSGRRTNSGTPTSWRDTVGQISRLSSLLMFATSTALAAPLLAITGTQSFAFCLYGRTRSGKTIATLVGSSVIGIGRTENLIGWNITDARLEERLSEFNDLLFPIDDLSTMRGSDREKYLRIRNLTYRVSQGWSTGRHSSFTRAHEGAHGGWRCIALTSAEKSIRDMAADAKVERQQGEVLRLIDVPAVFPGSDHVFDRRSANVPIPNFKAWRDTTFAGIVADCEANHGAPLRQYLEEIITADFDVREMARDAAASFAQHVADVGDDVVARDVAKKFGLVYAGGLLGIRLGIVPWQQDELLDAIAKCYRGARSLLPDEGVALRQGLAILQTRLSGLARAKLLKRHASTDWDKLDGYWRRKSGQDRYVIKREVFNALFATATQKNLVLKHLMENGQIAMAVRKSGGASSERKPRGQFYWPDGERRRSYEITFPRD
jgi:Domain of unknown function (DUF927)